MGLLSKNRDTQHNASQAKSSSGGGRFGHENRRDYGERKPSDGGLGGSTRSNTAFGFGGGPSSGGAFGNTNQYCDGGNGTGNESGSDGNLGNVHRTIFNMMEPQSKKFKGTIHLKNFMEAGG